MAQVKKSEKRDAIRSSAYKLFKEKGYLKCQMTDIAKSAGTAVSNIYVYFPSKLELFYDVYIPIINARMEELETQVNRTKSPRARLKLILLTLWQDLPNEDNCFAHNLMQAIITTPPDKEKPHSPLSSLEGFINDLIISCLPKNRQFILKDSLISFLFWMAFDGFTINVKVNELRDTEALVNHVCDLLMGNES